MLFTLLIFPLIDRIYIENFLDPATVVLPSIVAAMFALIIYLIGWYYIVTPPKSKQLRPVNLYLIFTAIVLVADLVLTGLGLVMLR